MALVNYSDSEGDVSDPDPHTNQRTQPRTRQMKNEEFLSCSKRKYETFGAISGSYKPLPPPLTSVFHSLYTTNVRVNTSDDPALHHGRKRQVPHVEGKWPSHVYLEWHPSRAESTILETIVHYFQARVPVEGTSSSFSKVHSLLQSDLGVQLPLHISLSASLMVRTEQRAAILEKLEDIVGASAIRPFYAHIAGLDWVPNSDRTRWFLVLKLMRPENDGLNILLTATNYVARDSGLETLYADPESWEEGLPKRDSHVSPLCAGTKAPNREHKQVSAMVPADFTSKFHVSIAWKLDEPDKESIASVDAPQPTDRLSIPCDCIKVKIGNLIHDIPLPEHRLSDEGLDMM